MVLSRFWNGLPPYKAVQLANTWKSCALQEIVKKRAPYWTEGLQKGRQQEETLRKIAANGAIAWTSPSKFAAAPSNVDARLTGDRRPLFHPTFPCPRLVCRILYERIAEALVAYARVEVVNLLEDLPCTSLSEFLQHPAGGWLASFRLLGC